MSVQLGIHLRGVYTFEVYIARFTVVVSAGESRVVRDPEVYPPFGLSSLLSFGVEIDRGVFSSEGVVSTLSVSCDQYLSFEQHPEWKFVEREYMRG